MKQGNNQRYYGRFILGIVTIISLFPVGISSAYAQNKIGEIVKDPICFRVVNTADHKMYGSFVTAYYQKPDGSLERHQSNFRLEEKGAKDKDGYPADMAEFCSYGPFYDGRELELVLRSLVPVFSCKTHIENGDIILKSHRDEKGILRMEAECK